ncbi:MAG TPA: glycosyltransferase family 39 protein [Aggregatilineales bacterium]|nr:glycosyltransferase family 39 protein [Aggregatilineales bacterium]
MRPPLFFRLILLILILIGFALRLYRLDVSPFRGDEAFTAQYWTLPLDQSLTQIATIEPHPALTYASYYLWGTVVGTDEFPLRMFPALISLLAIPALYGIGQHLGGRWTGLLAALLWVLQPYALWHAQDARNYALWSGLSAVGLWLGLIALRHNRLGDWLHYGLTITLAANLFYNEWFTIIGLGLYVLIVYRRDWSRVKRFFMAALLAVGTSGLSFLFLQLSLLGRGGYGGTASGFDLAFLPGLVTTLFFGRALPSAWIAIVFAGIVLFIIVVGFLLYRHERRTFFWLLCIALLPITLLSIASLRLKIFAPQYVLAALPGFVAVLAVSSLPRRLRLRAAPLQIIIWLSLLGYIGLSVISLFNYFYDPVYRKAANWPLVTDYLQAEVDSDDLVIQQSIDAAFGYYYRAEALDIALPSSPSQSVPEVERALAAYVTQHPSIWLVGQPYPDWPNGDAVQSWLDVRWQRVFDQWADGIHIQRYRPWTVADAELGVETSHGTFTGLVDLRAVQMVMPVVDASDLTVWLYWQPLAPSERDLRVFVHLVGGINPATNTPLWSQDDGPPQDGRISTQSWTVGTHYRDVYQVPLANVPSGTYELRVGFYDPVSGTRITTESGDSLSAGLIEVP